MIVCVREREGEWGGKEGSEIERERANIKQNSLKINEYISSASSPFEFEQISIYGSESEYTPKRMSA